jgi:hypothetical protein
MAKTITVMPNQSMSDVVVQATGSMNACIQFCKDNNVSAHHVPVVGTVYTITDSAIALGNIGVLTYLERNNITIGTLGDISEPSLHARILLKPVMEHVPNTIAPPSAHAGMYDFDLKEAPGFIHVYSIPSTAYPNVGCRLKYQAINDYMAALSYFISIGKDASGVGSPFMNDKDVLYTMLWVGGTGHLFAWDAFTGGINTLTFRDVNGNEAVHSPFLILDDVSQNAIGYMIADLHMDVLSATATTCTIRLTRSHSSSTYPEYANHSMTWLDSAIGGMPDPADPANPDKKILVFPTAGIFTLGVATTYTHLGYTWPSSKMTMVIEIF